MPRTRGFVVVTDKLGNEIRQFDVVFTGNRGTSRVAIVIDEEPTAHGNLRAVTWDYRFQRYDEHGNWVREWELSRSLIKDLRSSVKVHPEYWPMEVRRGVAAAKQRYGSGSTGQGSEENGSIEG